MLDSLKERAIKWPIFAWAYRQGGTDSFPLAHKDIMETVEDNVEKRAEELATQKLNDLLSVVDERSIVTFNSKNGLIYIGGEKAEDARLNSLKAEAEFFVQSDLWRILCESPKKLAQQAMFVEGDSLDHLKKGRAMLFTLDTQDRIVHTFKNLQQRM